MTCIVGIKVRGRRMGSPVAQQHRVMPAMLAVQRRAAALSLAKRLTWLSLSPPVSPAGPCAQGGARRGAHLPARRHHCAHGHRRQHPHRQAHCARVRHPHWCARGGALWSCTWGSRHVQAAPRQLNCLQAHVAHLYLQTRALTLLSADNQPWRRRRRHCHGGPRLPQDARGGAAAAAAAPAGEHTQGGRGRGAVQLGVHAWCGGVHTVPTSRIGT